MKLSRLKMIFFIALVISISSFPELFSQCPSTAGWNDKEASYDPYPHQLLGRVDFKEKVTGNTHEVVVDWSTLDGPPPWGISMDDWKEMMKLAIINKALGNESGLCTLHPNEEKHVIFYEEVDCNVGLACYVRVKSESSLTCIPPAWEPPPSWFNWSNEYYHKKTEALACGTGCCATDLTIKCESNLWIVTNAELTITGCPTSTHINCLTGNTIHCQAVCY